MLSLISWMAASISSDALATASALALDPSASSSAVVRVMTCLVISEAYLTTLNGRPFMSKTGL